MSDERLQPPRESSDVTPSDEAPLWLVIEDAYTSPAVNGEKFVHTVKADDAGMACRRVAEVIRKRVDRCGPEMLDSGVALTAVEWAACTTLQARDELAVMPL